MNPKLIVKTILIILGIYILAYIPLDAFVLNPPKKTIRYEVVDKRTGPYTESTGKYSSRTSDATFIRIRDENGSEETLTITDPFISDTYIVGNSYVKEQRVEDVSFLAFIICVCGLAFLIVFLGGCFVITLFWLSCDSSWVDVWNNPIQ